jgi:hypothetical protein
MKLYLRRLVNLRLGENASDPVQAEAPPKLGILDEATANAKFS